MPTGNPTYLTLSPTGAVGADFTGHVAAAGVDLIAGNVVSPPADRKIIWHKDSYTGAQVAQLVGLHIAGASSVVATSNNLANTTLAGLQTTNSDTVSRTLIAATNSTGVNGANVEVNVNANPGGTKAVTVSAQNAEAGAAPTYTKTVLDSANRSTFLQYIDNVHGVIFNGGNGTVTFPGGSQYSTATVLAHGLGAQANIIHATPTEGSSLGTIFAVATAVSGANDIQVQFRTVDGATPAGGTVASFFWSAFRIFN